MRSDNPRQLEHVAVATGVMKRREARRLCLLGQVRRNGGRVSVNDSLTPGDELSVRGSRYEVVTGGMDRLGLHRKSAPPARLSAPVRVHCGFHKCPTMYSRKVYRRASIALALSPAVLGKGPTGFRHYFHRQDPWLDNCHRYGITSLSGHCLDLEQFEDIKVVRFIRDPRDLIISGYFYHKKGAEHWCKYRDPIEIDYEVVNGAVPSALPPGLSLTEYVNEASEEDGLAAEIEFRRHHLESMMQWPEEDERVMVIRYEDIPGREEETFRKIMTFFGQSKRIAKKTGRDAHAYRAGAKEAKRGHVRNPTSGQWRDRFSPELNARFVELYQPLLERYNYPLE